MKNGGHPRFYEILDELADLHSRKNTDYAAGGEQGPLGGFQRIATIMSLYPGMQWGASIGVALTYMLKQLDAVLMLLSQKRESVTGEGVPERLKDVAVYSVIGMILAEEGRWQRFRSLLSGGGIAGTAKSPEKNDK